MSIQDFCPFLTGLFVFALLQVQFFDSPYWVILTSHVFVHLFLFSVVSCSRCLISLHVLEIVSAELF